MRGSTAGLVGRGGTAGVDSGGVDLSAVANGSMLKDSGDTIAAATAGTDYLAPTGTAYKLTSSSGQLLLGTTTAANTSPLLQVRNVGSADQVVAHLQSTGSSINPQLLIEDILGTGNTFVQFRTAGAEKGLIVVTDSGGMRVRGTGSTRIGVGDANASAADAGMITLDTFRKISLFGGGYADGALGILAIGNCGQVPTTNPSGGGILYVESGALKWRGSSGTITILGPA